MSSEMNTESVVMSFLKNIIKIDEILRKSNGIIDYKKILMMYKIDTYDSDSGFATQSNNSFVDDTLIPSVVLKEKIFENNDLDKLLENSFLLFWEHINKISTEAKCYSNIEEKLDFMFQFLTFLIESRRNVAFVEITETYLNLMLTNSLCDRSDSPFNFVMELFRRFGAIKELQVCIFDTIIKKLKIFVEFIAKEKEDTASLTFSYEIDFNRAYTLLLTVMIIKTENKNVSYDNDESVCNILQNFVNLDDYFSLGLLIFKSLLKE